MDNVICNDKVEKITTKYMRFYELEALLKEGKYAYVFDEIKNYWGGMVDMGATTFWEMYKPDEKKPLCFESYGRKYGKSLCHAWGSTPIYLIGKYYLGLVPTKIGYKEFKLTPQLEYLGDFDISLPINKGSINIKHQDGLLSVKYNYGQCKLYINNKEYNLKKNEDNIIKVK